MKAPLNKWLLRIATVLIGIVVLAINIVRLVYPSLTVEMTAIQAIATGEYIVFIGAYVGYDWGRESLQSK